MRLTDRKGVLRWALLLPVPLVPLAAGLVVHPFSQAGLVAGWLSLTLLCVAAAPLAGLGRVEAFALSAIAMAVTLMAGGAWLFAAILSLCTSSSATALASLAAGILPYLVWGAISLRSERPIGRLVGLPLAIAAGFTFSLVALYVLGGGTHHCLT